MSDSYKRRAPQPKDSRSKHGDSPSATYTGLRQGCMRRTWGTRRKTTWQLRAKKVSAAPCAWPGQMSPTSKQTTGRKTKMYNCWYFPRASGCDVGVRCRVTTKLQLCGSRVERYVRGLYLGINLKRLACLQSIEILNLSSVSRTRASMTSRNCLEAGGSWRRCRCRRCRCRFPGRGRGCCFRLEGEFHAFRSGAAAPVHVEGAMDRGDM
ncbi:hypothetical protein BDV95DRAFT_330974 [Massariosphaeria phaeospora]|uniref:Uncharacterized protein n=1 Tax=Massariosphaeria phaeospora TaxID=100035 RepID=A0A7C8MT72_9PLEO|nr:hypothetical protein BDV95DRAFT_330974 [Massariosphaeria phaeospora]